MAREADVGAVSGLVASVVQPAWTIGRRCSLTDQCLQRPGISFASGTSEPTTSRISSGIAGQLFGRVGLARQEGLVDVEIAAFQQTRIRRNRVPGDQLDDVAGDRLIDGHR